MNNKISSTYTLDNLSDKELAVLAAQMRQEIISATSNNGGHLSSNLGVVELTIGLVKFFDITKDKILFDVGHQCYTYKLLTGRDLTSLRKKDGIAPFQKMSESAFDYFEAGHSSTSLSAALGMAVARDLDNKEGEIIAFIGDSSIVSGMALEALNNIGQLKEHKIIIILNDNEMSISKPVGAMSIVFSKLRQSMFYHYSSRGYRRFMEKTKIGKSIYNWTRNIKNRMKKILIPDNIFENFGLVYYGVVDGHSFKGLEKAFNFAGKQDKSTIIHVHTIKGKGYSYSLDDETGYWHGVSPFDKSTGKPKDMHYEKISLSHVTSDLLHEKMLLDNDAIIISPATCKGASLDEIFAEFPLRTFDVGIAEEHAVTFASGLSLAGKHPIVSIYSTFFQRAFDQFSHDVARIKCPSLFILERAGLVGNDGETHQGLYDEAFLFNTPNTLITQPFDYPSLQYLIANSFTFNGPQIIRLPRELILKEQLLLPLQIYPFGDFVLSSTTSSSSAIIGVGGLAKELFSLIKTQYDCYHVIYLNNISDASLDLIVKYDKIVIYDPYSTSNGFTNNLEISLRNLKYQGEIIKFSLPVAFVQFASQNEQLCEYGLDIVSVAKNLMK